MKKRLFTPGPTPVPESVMLRMAEPMIHHRHSEFKEILSTPKPYRPRGPHALIPIGTGTTISASTSIAPNNPGCHRTTDFMVEMSDGLVVEGTYYYRGPAAEHPVSPRRVIFPEGTDFQRIKCFDDGTLLAPQFRHGAFVDWVVVGRCTKSQCVGAQQ